MARANIITGLAAAVLAFCIWAGLNRPEPEPPWPDRVQGFCLSPMQAGQSPLIKKYPTSGEITSDLALLAGKTFAVRTYAVEYTLGDVAALAGRFGINVALGAWVDADGPKTEAEIEDLIRTARSNATVVRAIVGNEVVLRGDIPKTSLIGYLDRVRSALDVPVSTAEPWHVWLKHPDLADHVDFLAVHMLPYWEGVHVDAAVDYVVRQMEKLKDRFPRKPIVIAEVGWPSHGRTRKAAVASPSNEATFLRRFIERARKENYIYYLMEAFDQPWKRETEGAVGAYWGVYDIHRKEKFPFTAPIVAVPNWYVLAGISVLLAGIIMALLLADSGTLQRRGRHFLAVMAYFAATAAVWIVHDYFHQYWTWGTVLVGAMMLAGLVGVILILLTEAHEWAEALWTAGSRRTVQSLALGNRPPPFISIHVPAYNEPPSMLKETLDALNHLDYPHYEVLVVDNNTRDRRQWKPVADYCIALGPRFRFFHVSPLSGFKAGALNFALDHTHPHAQIVAVIDSDYQVEPDWLKDLAPYFHHPEVALVQAPQDYRDGQGSAFKAMCHSEYKGFFHIGMVTRNARNAIIQHGTMTMVRRAALESVGGWGTWCITEDAELGLRLFEHGYQGVYIAKSYGKGLMPHTFGDYQRQRFRWAYGAMQIMRRHAGHLLGYSAHGLDLGQRYHFVAGWLPWLADGANLVFNLFALLLSAVMIIAPQRADPPLAAISMMLLTLFVFKICKIVYLYRNRVNAGMAQTAAAILAGLSLSHTVAKAVLLGIATHGFPFQRTPKHAAAASCFKGAGTVVQEGAMMMFLLAASFGVLLSGVPGNLDLYLWSALLAVQAMPYAAAVIVMRVDAGCRAAPSGQDHTNSASLARKAG